MPSQRTKSNATAEDQQWCVHQLIESQCHRTPIAVALEFGYSEKITYGELNQRSERLADILRSHGVQSGSCIALCLPRSINLVVAVISVLKAGAGYAPLDPTYPTDRLAYMLEDAKPAALLTTRQLERLLPKPACTVIYLEDVNFDANSGLVVHVNPEATEERLAYILFTSGSTGRPKGVLMPHRPLVNLMQWHQRAIPLPLHDRVVQFAPLSFDVSAQEIFTTLAEGGTLVLINDELRRDPQGLLRFLVHHRINRLYLPFVALQQLAEIATASGPIPSALKDVITAGEQLQISEEIRGFFQQMPSTRLHNHYGPTETHVVTAYTLPHDPAGWPTLPPIGRAIDHSAVHLFNEKRQPVPLGSPGEIYLSGRCVALGYLNQPSATGEKFPPDPTNPGQRMYRTGDLGQLRSDGEIEFLGRADDQVKIRGHRVELGEVEAALRKCPGVKDCAVAAHSRGTDKVLAAYFIANAQATPRAEEIRSFLLANLPEPMVPAFYVAIESLPLTPSGKLNRRALPAPEVTGIVRNTTRVSLANDLERMIAAAWEGVLGSKGVGATDSFFAIGGTSLMVAQVQRRLQTELRRDIPITLLFQYATIRQLAAQLGTKPADVTAHQSAISDRAARQREAMARQQLSRTKPPAQD